MILFPAASLSGEKPSLFSAAELMPLLDRTGAEIPLVEEIARAVEEYVVHWLAAKSIDARGLFVLAARAMWAVGEQDLAARVFLLGTGAVHPAEWDVAGPGGMWILDLGQFVREEDQQLELVLVSTLDTTLEVMAGFWDRTAGSGALGLRWRPEKEAPRGLTAKRRLPNPAICWELSHHCRTKLEQLSRRRAWLVVPRVINLHL